MDAKPDNDDNHKDTVPGKDQIRQTAAVKALAELLPELKVLHERVTAIHASLAAQPEPLSKAAEPADESLGQRLRALRRQAGLSQEEVAQRAQVDLATIKRLERGETSAPQPRTLDRLFAVLALPPRDLPSLPALGRREGALWWSAPDYDPIGRLRSLAQEVAVSGRRLDPALLYLEAAAAAHYLRYASESERRPPPRTPLAALLLRSLGGGMIDVVALGCGAGVAEVALVQALRAARPADPLRLCLVDLCQPLLCEALRESQRMLAGGLSGIVAALADLRGFAWYGAQLLAGSARRLCLLLGDTFASALDERALLEELAAGMTPGDLLLCEAPLRSSEAPQRGAPPIGEELDAWLGGVLRRVWEVPVTVTLRMEPAAGSACTWDGSMGWTI